MYCFSKPHVHKSIHKHTVAVTVKCTVTYFEHCECGMPFNPYDPGTDAYHAAESAIQLYLTSMVYPEWPASSLISEAVRAA